MTADRSAQPQDAAAAARGRLAALQQRAAHAYAAITAADAALQVIAARRMAAERALRQAVAARQAAVRAAAAHQRGRPGPLAALASVFRGGPDWRRGQAARDAAVTAAEGPLADARQALALVRDEFADQLQARAEPVAALRRLTAQCAAAQAEIARYDGGPDHPEQAGVFSPGTHEADAVPTDGLVRQWPTCLIM
jgi:hypothetical protein